MNQRLTPEIWLRRSMEIRFLSGRGGRFSSISDFLSSFDLPLSQVNFITTAGEIVSANELQPGNQYQIVITPDRANHNSIIHNLYFCISCGDPLTSKRGAPGKCAECLVSRLCEKCLVVMSKEWEDYLQKQGLITHARAGAKICMLCLLSLPDSLSPASDECHHAYWRLRIVKARVVDVD